MNALTEKIVLKETITVSGTLEDVKLRINQGEPRTYQLVWLSDHEFKFISNWSIGTLKITGLPIKADGIKGHGTIVPTKDPSSWNIEMETKVRIELYFFLVLFAFFVLVYFLDTDKREIPIWAYFAPPITLIWFWGVLRLQEKALFNRVKRHLLPEN
ncbi:MAG: hypothetical protein AAFP77_20310 [Bacteroidota bacterium]